MVEENKIMNVGGKIGLYSLCVEFSDKACQKILQIYLVYEETEYCNQIIFPNVLFLAAKSYIKDQLPPLI